MLFAQVRVNYAPAASFPDMWVVLFKIHAHACDSVSDENEEVMLIAPGVQNVVGITPWDAMGDGITLHS